jgi:TonB family protein
VPHMQPLIRSAVVSALLSVVVTTPLVYSAEPAYIEPQVLSQKKPRYPWEMDRFAIPAEVTIDFVVDDHGEVREPRIVKSTNPAFDEPALDAVLKWRFKSAMREGKPVSTHLRLPIVFQHDNPGHGFKMAKVEPGKKPDELSYFTPPARVNLLLPTYPYALLRDSVVGKADVTITVDDRGRVAGINIDSADRPEFGLALAAAAAEFEFTPARDGDKPVVYPSHYEQIFDRFPLLDDNAKRLLALETKHPEQILDARALDRPLKPCYGRSPVFPWTLPRDVTEGKAVVECLVDERGHARLPRIVSASVPEFGYSAAQAANSWWFEPPTKAQKPVVTRVRIPFSFSLTPRNPKPPNEVTSVK